MSRLAFPLAGARVERYLDGNRITRRVGTVLLVLIMAVVAAGGVTEKRVGIALLGVVGVGITLLYPAVSLIAVATICQELKTTTGGRAASLFTFGHQMYFINIGRLPLVFWASAFAAVGAFIQWADAGMPRFTGSSMAAKLVLILALLAVVLSVAGHSTLTTALGQDGRPFLILFFSWFVAATLDYQRGGRRQFCRLAFFALCTAALLGFVDLYFRHGQALSVNVDPTDTSAETLNRFLLFYDSALPALAGAVLLAVLLRRTQWKAVLPAVVVTGWITIFSFRRSVWISLPVVLLTLFIFGKQRARILGRVLLPLAIVIAALHFSDPGLTREMSSRFGSAVSAAEGRAAYDDTSTTGHVSDIHQGWAYATSKPLRGWGPDVGQLPNLVVAATPGTRLYVHDEYLMDWIRFGALGLALVLTVIGSLAYQAVRILRTAGVQSLDRVASAVFLLVFPICCITAPFLTTTNRWPLLVGLAAGLVSTTGTFEEPPRETSLTTRHDASQQLFVAVEPLGQSVLLRPGNGGGPWLTPRGVHDPGREGHRIPRR
jgi:O-antigen ligase